MPIPIIALVAGLGGAAFVWALSNDGKKSGGGGGGAPGALPGAGQGGSPDPNAAMKAWFSVRPNGVIALRPERQPELTAVLSQKFVSPSTVANVPAGSVLIHEVNTNGKPALQWCAEQGAMGKHVLLSLDPKVPIMAPVSPGDELTWANANRGQFGLIAEAGTPQGGGMPGGGAQGGQQQGGFNVPGVGTIPINFPGGFPGMPGGGQQQPPPQGQPQNQPASSTQPAPPQTIDTPWGPFQVPGGFGIPGAQQPPQGQGAPAPPPPQNGGQQAPGGIVLPGGFTIPGGVIPGGAIPGMPPQQGGGANGAVIETATGPWPAAYVHKIRQGDIASKIAQHYTGDFTRAEEIRALNNLTKKGSGANTYYEPWKLNQLIKLPTDWPVVQKGPPPQQGGSSRSLTVAGDDAEGVLLQVAKKRGAKKVLTALAQTKAKRGAK
jgi:hypothetical protein